MLKKPLNTYVNRFHRFSAAVIGASLTMSSLALGVLPVQSAPQAQAPSPQSSEVASGLPDGVYLYGEASKPDEIGKGYFVFEAKAGKVVGALYMPFSSFDCASGSFANDQLALTVVNSYDRSTNPFEIALDKTATVASNNPMQSIGLQGFYKLDKVSENDQRMLGVCKADLQGKDSN